MQRRDAIADQFEFESKISMWNNGILVMYARLSLIVYSVFFDERVCVCVCTLYCSAHATFTFCVAIFNTIAHMGKWFNI